MIGRHALCISRSGEVGNTLLAFRRRYADIWQPIDSASPRCRIARGRRPCPHPPHAELQKSRFKTAASNRTLRYRPIFHFRVLPDNSGEYQWSCVNLHSGSEQRQLHSVEKCRYEWVARSQDLRTEHGLLRLRAHTGIQHADGDGYRQLYQLRP